VLLLHLVGGLLTSKTDFTTRLELALSRIGEDREAIVLSYERWVRTDPQHNGVAGRDLRVWFAKNNPRSPVSVARFSTDDVGSTDIDSAEAEPSDFVGISAESTALAYLVASRALVPPLAVGLFGDWGSGKSFMMRDIRSRVKRLVALSAAQEQHTASVWKNIKHVQFNAWEYVHGDLWAALLEKVFTTLDARAADTSLVAARRKPLIAELERRNSAVAIAGLRSIGLQIQLNVARATLRSAEEELAREEHLADKNSVEALTALHTVRAVLDNQWKENQYEGLVGDIHDLTRALQEASREVRNGRAVLGPYWRKPTHILAATMLALVVPFFAWGLQWLQTQPIFSDLPEVNSVLAALAVSVPAFTVWLRGVTSWSAKQRALIERTQEKIDADLQRPVLNAKTGVESAKARVADRASELSAQDEERFAEQRGVSQIQAEIDEITAGRALVDFAGERSVDYRRRLGLLGVVRDDLRTLAREVQENNRRAQDRDAPDFDKDMANRIVLYIDDLDRCPPTKVVQVLEAVHLLLAFPMFVVFVAVDSRWLTSALVEELHVLRRPDSDAESFATKGDTFNDSPTACDYLEKIFQVPFWVQPLSGEQRGAIMQGLLAPSLRADAVTDDTIKRSLKLSADQAAALDGVLGRAASDLRFESSVLTLSQSELEFIGSFGTLIGDTPRRVKRFVNTVQFLLSIRPSLSATGERPPRQAVALFAAIHDGLPSVSRAVFDPENGASALADLIAGEVDESERSLLVAWLELPGHDVWSQATLNDIGTVGAMVQRLAFDRPGGAQRTTS